MNVYLITKQPFPLGMAAVNRIKCYAKSMLLGGINCKIVVYSRTDINCQLPHKGIVEGVPYEYIGGSSKRVKGKLLGKIQSFYLQLYLCFFLLFQLKKGDIVFGYGHGMKWLWKIMIYLIHSKDAYYVSELCELPYGMGKETSTAKKNRKIYLNKVMPTYDGIIPISDALADLAQKHCNPKCVIEKIPILVDFEKYNLPNNFSSADYPYIFHSGTLYEQKDGILGMIEAFGIATNQMSHKLHFVITGSEEKSPHRAEIDKLIEKYNLYDVIHFTGYLSNEELKDKLSKASLVIINKYTTQQNVYCFSTKLAEYMAAGKPIIITRVGEAMNWLRDKHDCLVVEPNNVQQLSNTIVNVIQNYSEFIALGNNARISCKEYFGYKKYSEVFKQIFTKLEK